MKFKLKGRLSLEEYAEGILGGNRIILSKAITLVESSLPEDQDLSNQVLEKILAFTGKSLRIGITGVPGVGKSTFIETFGTFLTSKGKKLAVLAIDPSSQKTKGSILGDKTRMEKLAGNPMAYIRPSATGNTLGGVHSHTRQAILLCEAAGFDIVIVETVGVGQSEVAVNEMVDFFLLLMLAGAGDELQGIKKGIMEMADVIVINKADGENVKAALQAKKAYENALHLFQPSTTGWNAKVLTCSALENKGISDLWVLIKYFQNHMKGTGNFERKRNHQNLQWMQDYILFHLKSRFYSHPSILSEIQEMESKVANGTTTAINAGKILLDKFFK